MAANISLQEWEAMSDQKQAEYYGRNKTNMVVYDATTGDGNTGRRYSVKPRNMNYYEKWHAFELNPNEANQRALMEAAKTAYGGSGGTSSGSSFPAGLTPPSGGLQLKTQYYPRDFGSKGSAVDVARALKAAGYGVAVTPSGGIVVTKIPQNINTSTPGSGGSNPSATSPWAGVSGGATPTQMVVPLTSEFNARIDNYAAKIENIQNSQLALADKMTAIAKERNAFEMELAKTQEGRAADLWQRWKTVYEPLETQFVKESQAGTPLDYAAQRAGAGVQQQFNKLEQQEETGLRSAGYSEQDPTWQRAQRIRDIAKTATQAGAMNTARDTTRTENWEKKKFAVGLGEPYAQKATATTSSAAGMTTGGLPGLGSAGQLKGMAAGELKDIAGLYSVPYSNMMDWYKLITQGQYNVQAAKEGKQPTALDWLKWATQ